MIERPIDPVRLDRSNYELTLDEQFDGPVLDERAWLPVYLPQWSSRDRTAARYDVGGATGGTGLRLRIDQDQTPWAPEWDRTTRVSNLQTGVFSGPVGSGIGQHHFRPDLVVREAQAPRRLYTPQHGIVEIRAKALADPSTLCAFWLIGFEDAPERSAEICLMEVFGLDIGDGATKVGLGVHPFGDPTIEDDFGQVEVPIDARDAHTYSAEWLPDRVRFYIDDDLVKVVRQSPAYPMQLMLNIYEFTADESPRDPSAYPKAFGIDWVRGWRPSSTPKNAL